MPQQGTVSKLMKRFRETGSVVDKLRSGHPHPSTNLEHTVDVFANFAVSLHRSTQKHWARIGNKSHVCFTHSKEKQIPPLRSPMRARASRG